MSEQELAAIEARFEVERDMHPMADFPAQFYALTAEVRRLAGEVAALRKATRELVDAIGGDYAADHHEDECPGDCEDHAVGYLIDKALAASKL